ncbi:MAG: apolipoprotein N-acyltransferase [Caedibacter sp. 37-49]|nr:MAG: apolipoprotein N-acyltransferase [Caedibacter sp. 37-49]
MIITKLILWLNKKLWRIFALAFFLGACCTLAFEPFSWFFMVFVSIGGLLWVLDNFQGHSLKKAFLIGWWYGLGYFTTSLYWIAFALGVDLKQFAWLIPFTVLGLPAILSLFIAPVTFLTRSFNCHGIGKALLFSMLWAGFEWLRGHLFTGLPWNLVAYTWVPYESISQSLSFLGVYGLSLITVFIATLLYCALAAKIVKERITYCLLASTLLISMYGFGKWRLANIEEAVVPGIYLRLVQPNIPQKLKWDREYAEKNYEKILTITKIPAKKEITHVLWPESAVPFLIEYDHEHRERLKTIIPPQGVLLTGGINIKRHSRFNVQVWNSIFVIKSNADIIDIYNKSHLVPFGEYIPMRSLFPSFVKKVTAGSVDFSFGSGPRTLKVPGLPAFSPLVCYEGIFPGAVKSKGGERPQWIYNATNDAWYGPTSGPYQHLVINRARAIEEGLPYMRVANTGISAVIDAYGRIKQSLPLNTSGVIDAELPLATALPTLYSLYGDTFFFVLLAAYLLSFLCIFYRDRQKKIISQ